MRRKTAKNEEKNMVIKRTKKRMGTEEIGKGKIRRVRQRKTAGKCVKRGEMKKRNQRKNENYKVHAKRREMG